MRKAAIRFTRCSAGTNSWLAPVGRLDKASEGLLLFTNDSEWSARLLAPESHLDKTYHVQIAAVADQMLLDRLAAGVDTPDGLLRVKAVPLLARGPEEQLDRNRAGGR